jgi:hypothetical protein
LWQNRELPLAKFRQRISAEVNNTQTVVSRERVRVDTGQSIVRQIHFNKYLHISESVPVYLSNTCPAHVYTLQIYKTDGKEGILGEIWDIVAIQVQNLHL